jgi:hypothetical protein
MLNCVFVTESVTNPLTSTRENTTAANNETDHMKTDRVKQT